MTGLTADPVTGLITGSATGLLAYLINGLAALPTNLDHSRNVELSPSS